MREASLVREVAETSVAPSEASFSRIGSSGAGASDGKWKMDAGRVEL